LRFCEIENIYILRFYENGLIIILLQFTISEDPVFVLKHTKPPVNSVLKILVDLFSMPETTNLFYTNDIKVLIDILVRQLSDLSAGDPVSIFND
jgi:hypothetical protein